MDKWTMLLDAAGNCRDEWEDVQNGQRADSMAFDASAAHVAQIASQACDCSVADLILYSISAKRAERCPGHALDMIEVGARNRESWVVQLGVAILIQDVPVKFFRRP